MQGASATVFTDISLPNATTWFYFSGLLAVALFFKFGRLFSLRNLDVLTLYLFAPGLMLVGDPDYSFLGYLALLLASGYFLLRCLLDLALTRRPALGPNLDLAGLAWLAGALYISLVAVTLRQPVPRVQPLDLKTPTTPIADLPEVGTRVVERPIAERVMSLVCHLSVVIGLILIGGLIFENVASGMSAATFYLLLPYTFFLVPDSALGMGRWDHPWAMALTVWAVLCYRRPLLAGMFLGAAVGTSIFLIVILPAWLSFYGPRGATRFLLAVIVSASLGLALLAGIFWLNGEWPSSLQSPWRGFDWLPWKKPPEGSSGFWQAMALSSRGMAAYRIPVFVASMALVLLSAFWPRPKTLAHVIALSVASLLTVQFWYADRGGVYILWYLPLLLLLVFRPNLEDKIPREPRPDDLLARLVGALGWFVRFLVARVTSPGRLHVRNPGGG